MMMMTHIGSSAPASFTRQDTSKMTSKQPILTKRPVLVVVLVVTLCVNLLVNPDRVSGFHGLPTFPRTEDVRYQLAHTGSSLSRQGFSTLTSSSSMTTTTTTTCLFMGKLRSRQAELQRKMTLAKKQNASSKDAQPAATTTTSSSSTAQQQTDDDGVDTTNTNTALSRLSDQEMKEQNDRKRFEELLRGYQVFTGEDDNYMNEKQEEESIDAYRRGADRLFEGDPAPTAAFEELISIKSENAIGETGAKRLVPWLRNSASDDYLVVISDPRVKSTEFHDAIRAVRSELTNDIVGKIVFINADTPAENRRFLKKNNLMDTGIKLFSDEKREWMQSYTALGENRWSMTMFIISKERIQKLVRELASVDAAIVVDKAIKAMEKRRL